MGVGKSGTKREVLQERMVHVVNASIDNANRAYHVVEE